MKIAHPVLALTLSLLLLSCGGETVSSLSSTPSEEETTSLPSSSTAQPEMPAPNDVKAALLYLQSNHDYTLKADEGEFTLHYAPGYFYLDEGLTSIGYVASEGGVYRLLLDERGNLRGSELIEGQELYGSGLFPSLADLDLSKENIGEGEESYALTNKVNKLAVLTLLERPSSDFLKATSFLVKAGSALTDFRIEVTIDGQVYSLSVASLEGNAEAVDSYLDRGGSFYAVPDDLASYRDKFFLDNYKRDVLDIGDPTLSYGTEYFMPTYWVGLYNDYGHSQGAFDQAFVSFSHVELLLPQSGEDGSIAYVSHVLDGTYLYMLSNLDDGLQVSPVISYPYITTSDLTDVSSGLGYIKQALFWDYLEFADPMGDGTYLIDDSALAIDFDTLNGGHIQSAGYYPRSIMIAPHEEGGESYIDFAVNYSVGNANLTSGATHFSFFGFGEANVAEVEKATDEILAYQVA